MVSCPLSKMLSCWRLWVCDDNALNWRMRNAVAQICKEGITTEGIRVLKDVLDEVDCMKGNPSSLWRIEWCNRNATYIHVKQSDDQEFNIYLLLA